MLDDGAAGMWLIKHTGGTTVVQDPEDAKYPSMPLNCLSRVDVHHVAALADMASLIQHLVGQPITEEVIMDRQDRSRAEIEVEIASDNPGALDRLLAIGEPTMLSCPDCHGVLMDIKEGTGVCYRCHTGHGYSEDSLRAAIAEDVEDTTSQAIRSLHEFRFVYEKQGHQLLADGQKELGQQFLDKAQQARERARVLFEDHGSWAIPAAGETGLQGSLPPEKEPQKE